MNTEVRRALRDERGVIAIFIALAITMFFGAAAMAVDIGMMATARGEAQRAADAAALAGASVLAYGVGTGEEARQLAIDYVARNPVRSLSVTPTASDVEISGDTVRVHVVRSATRGNAVPTLFARMLGRHTVDVSASAAAAAETGPARVVCLLPIAIPDRWVNRRGQVWDPGQGDYYPSLFRRDGTYNPDHVGFDAPGELLQIRPQDRPLRFEQGRGRLRPDRAFIWLPEGERGQREVGARFTGCPDGTSLGRVSGDWLPWYDSNNHREVNDRVREILSDPRWAGQYYDPDCVCVRDAADDDAIVTGGLRFRALPIFDPSRLQTWSLTENLRVTHFLGVFIERITGNRNNPTLHLRTLPIVAAGGGYPHAGPFVKVIRLVH